MDEQFELPVEYNGQQLLFKATLVVYGFTHTFHVDANGQTIIFEPDEERNYRAILNYGDLDKKNNVDVELIKEITKAIESIGQ